MRVQSIYTVSSTQIKIILTDYYKSCEIVFVTFIKNKIKKNCFNNASGLISLAFYFFIF